MKRYIEIGGVQFCLDAERPIKQTADIISFYMEKSAFPDVTVHVTWDWLHTKHPKNPPVGRDLIQIYYQDQNEKFCELAGGDRGALACTRYTADCHEMVCAVNEINCQVPQDTDGQLLRMLPMREIFLRFGVLFLHASQVAYRGRGILFTAPSGTGKSTQAKLWRQYQGAEIICNDRTLVRNVDGVWRTYGYPLDGSEPVKSSAVHRLGAVVLLEQGVENTVKRLRPSKALPRLMEQLVLDCWNSEARTAALDLLIQLMEQIPVYLLCCTPDEQAVETLKEQLMEDEVIPRG